MEPRVFKSTDDRLALIETEALLALSELADSSVDLVLSDPPWNTRKKQTLGPYAYGDHFMDFASFLVPVLQQMRRVLRPAGVCIIHMGIQEAHNVRTWLDKVFGVEHFLAELIAHHEAGRGAGTCWAQKHSHILVYSKGDAFVFNADKIPLTERKAPVREYIGPKRVNSVLPATMSTTDGQRVGYPSQKSLELYQALIEVHTRPGAIVCDPFCGSGTTGDAAWRCGRAAILADNNSQAVDLAARRLGLHLCED